MAKKHSLSSEALENRASEIAENLSLPVRAAYSVAVQLCKLEAAGGVGDATAIVQVDQNIERSDRVHTRRPFF